MVAGEKEENPRVSWGTWELWRERGNSRRNVGTLQGTLRARDGLG